MHTHAGMHLSVCRHIHNHTGLTEFDDELLWLRAQRHSSQMEIGKSLLFWRWLQTPCKLSQEISHLHLPVAVWASCCITINVWFEEYVCYLFLAYLLLTYFLLVTADSLLETKDIPGKEMFTSMIPIKSHKAIALKLKKRHCFTTWHSFSFAIRRIFCIFTLTDWLVTAWNSHAYLMSHLLLFPMIST